MRVDDLIFAQEHVLYIVTSLVIVLLVNCKYHITRKLCSDVIKSHRNVFRCMDSHTHTRDAYFPFKKCERRNDQKSMYGLFFDSYTMNCINTRYSIIKYPLMLFIMIGLVQVMFKFEPNRNSFVFKHSLRFFKFLFVKE